MCLLCKTGQRNTLQHHIFVICGTIIQSVRNAYVNLQTCLLIWNINPYIHRKLFIFKRSVQRDSWKKNKRKKIQCFVQNWNTLLQGQHWVRRQKDSVLYRYNPMGIRKDKKECKYKANKQLSQYHRLGYPIKHFKLWQKHDNSKPLSSSTTVEKIQHVISLCKYFVLKFTWSSISTSLIFSLTWVLSNMLEAPPLRRGTAAKNPFSCHSQNEWCVSTDKRKSE